MIIAFDTETDLIGPGQLAPPIICGSFARRNTTTGFMVLDVSGNHPDDDLEFKIGSMLLDPKVEHIVTHNGGYDWVVVMAAYPRLTGAIFDAMISGKLVDTLWREKLLNLSITGSADKLKLPDGSKTQISYSLNTLSMNYGGRDRSAEKDGEDIWRLNYNVLDGWRSKDYPDDAYAYAAEDAEATLGVYEGQEVKLETWPDLASVVTQGFQLASSICLQLMTAWGMKVNHAATEVMDVAVQKVMRENQDLLLAKGILQPEQLPRPHSRQMKKVAELMSVTINVDIVTDWSAHREMLEAAGIKFTAGKDQVLKEKPLQDYVRALYKRLGEMPTYTASTIEAMTAGDVPEEERTICMEAEIRGYLAGKDEVMEQLDNRQELSKIRTQMIPILRSGDVIHPSYDALKETSRTSCYDGGKARRGAGPGAKRMFPSGNLQQVPGLIGGLDPRACFEPREGRVYFDVDFSGLELAGVGYVTNELFGHSVHLERYNAGTDLHGYLGAQLALGTDEGMAREFAQACRTEGILGNKQAVYEAFAELKVHDTEEVRKFYAHFRKFAKPVGLGYPGGLGAATMVDFARKTYNVRITEERAGSFKEMWLEVYPEMPEFFAWVNAQTDQHNVGKEGRALYQYVTPFGMVRRGCTFCAEANGMGMQSPGAEAAKTAKILVQQACYVPGVNDTVYGMRPIIFLHDQIIGETTTDESTWHEQCMEVARIMREGAERVLTTVKMRTDEALLTGVWSKSAEPTWEGGRLIPWMPKEAV